MDQGEAALAEAFAGKLSTDGGVCCILQVSEPAQSETSSTQGNPSAGSRGKKDATVCNGVWGYSTEGFGFQGQTYHGFVQIYGGEGKVKLHLNASKDRKEMKVIGEKDGAFATWFAAEWVPPRRAASI